MQTENTQTGVRASFVQPWWVAAALIVSWLGLWVHELLRAPAQRGFTPDGSLPMLLVAIMVFLAWWRFPQQYLPLAGIWIVCALHLLAASLSILPLPIWPFVPEQTLPHFVAHGIYFVAQIPLLVVAVILLRRRVLP
jgi:hypothetical protein